MSSEFDFLIRNLIDNRYPERGRFTQLEKESGISSQKWRNFYYRKQRCTNEMLQFWLKNYSNDLLSISSGGENEYPFFKGIVPESNKLNSVATRAKWIIEEQCGNKNREDFLHELSDISGGSVPVTEWKQFIEDGDNLTVEMLAAITRFRPYFSEWLIHGKIGERLQVNPGDGDFSRRWAKIKINVGEVMNRIILQGEKILLYEADHVSDEDKEKWSSLIKKLLKKRNWTIRQLAGDMGVLPVEIEEILSGTRVASLYIRVALLSRMTHDGTFNYLGLFPDSILEKLEKFDQKHTKWLGMN